MKTKNDIIKNAEILCVGTELLLGDIINTNAAFLSTRLAELGINVYRHTVVGDNPERLKKALSSALEDSDLVITSGGLGPTYDDLTKETVAECFGRKMFLHEESLERIKEYFRSSNKHMADNNIKQAMMPDGAIVFPNPYGTAPSLALVDEDKNKTVIMLPGPPNELIPLFNEQISQYLRGRCEGVLVSKNINIFGIGESNLEELLGDLMQTATNPTVAPYCKMGEVRLRVTASSTDVAEASRMCDEMIARIEKSEIGQYIYGIDADTMEMATVKALSAKGLTLALAESCTGGLIAKRITDVSGASEVFLGSCVTYANSAKQRLVEVSGESLEKYGAVSEAVALEMARGARLALGSDIAISTTGVAGPTGGTPEKPVGTVYVGISTENGEKVIKLSLSALKSREYIRNVTVNNALNLVLSFLKEKSE